MLVDTDTGPATWTNGLKKYGHYFEGIVERVEHVLELHKQDTVTTFGIRRTEKPRSSPTVGKGTINQSACTLDKPKV